MKILFTATEQEPQAWGLAGSDWAQQMENQYRQSPHPGAELVDDPEQADIIVFWEPYQTSQLIFAPRLRAHPWVQRFPEKVFVVSPEDEPLGFLSGLYCSLPRKLFNPARHRTWIYQGTLNPHVQSARAKAHAVDPARLATFVGARSHSSRGWLFENAAYLAANNIHVRETSSWKFNSDPHNPANREDQFRYIDEILDSKFGLCPRGGGTGSFRLQETMALHRAPVIIGDAWAPIKGPNWEACAVFVREAELRRLPEILTGYAPRWREMGLAAGAAYDEFFRLETYAFNAISQILDLHQNRKHREADAFAEWERMIASEHRRRQPSLIFRIRRKLGRLLAR